MEIPNPVAEAYIRYLETGEDYYQVLTAENERARKALNKAAMAKAEERVNVRKCKRSVADDVPVTEVVHWSTCCFLQKLIINILNQSIYY